MTDLMKLIQNADSAAIEFERARALVDTMKQQLEAAKEVQDKARAELDVIVSRADELGVPRAKVKKLIEERAQALLASGLISSGADSRVSSSRAANKTPKAPKKLKAVPDMDEDDLANRPANEGLIAGMN